MSIFNTAILCRIVKYIDNAEKVDMLRLRPNNLKLMQIRFE